MELPTIDGHFWVVRDGKIIDTDFEDYAYICKVRNLIRKDKHYLEAPVMTQKIMTAMFLKTFKYVFEVETFEEICSSFNDFSKHVGMTKPEFGRCFQNCLIEIAENGGDLKFGSLGMKKRNKEGYFYEYGGIEYTKISDFRKN